MADVRCREQPGVCYPVFRSGGRACAVSGGELGWGYAHSKRGFFFRCLDPARCAGLVWFAPLGRDFGFEMVDGRFEI